MDKDAGYVWGDEVQLKDVAPGEILQFRDYTVTTTTIIESTFADGSSPTETKTKTANRGHHRAIVDGRAGPGALRILEQHVKPLGQQVQRHELSIQDAAPAPKTSHKTVKTPTGKLKPATVVETITVEVTGTVRAYRPKPN